MLQASGSKDPAVFARGRRPSTVFSIILWLCFVHYLHVSQASGSKDHPLSVDEGSAFNQHFKDMEAMEQIDRDVDRTHSDVPFFGDEASPESATHREVCPRS